MAGLTRRETVTRVDLGQQQSVQLRIADAAARIEPATASLRQLAAEMNARAHAGEEIAMVAKLECRLALAHAARLSIEAVDGLFPLLGGRGLGAGDAVQRAWRDVHAVGRASRSEGVRHERLLGGAGAISQTDECASIPWPPVSMNRSQEAGEASFVPSAPT